MRAVKFGVIAVSAALVIYLCGTFVNLEMDVMQWSKHDRVFGLIMWAAVMAACAAEMWSNETDD